MTNDTKAVHSPEILVVDDLPENLKTLSAMLSKYDYKVRFAQNGSGALRSIESKKPDLILLDIRMPDMNGYEVCQRIKSDASTTEIPVIFISALSDSIDKVKAFQVGGVDYITKPFNPDEVLARINTHLHIRRLQQELKKYSETLEQKVQDRTAELQKSRDQYSRFVEGLPVGIFRAEPRADGHILMANPAAAAMLGFQSFADMDDISLRDLHCRRAEQHRFEKLLQIHGSVRNFAMPITKNDGSQLIARITAQLVVDREGTPQFLDGVMEDITELQRAANAKGKLEHQLRQAQKMEAIGTLAGGIAHDFNNILAAIMGHTELAIMDAERKNRPTGGFKAILNASLRAKELTGQILSFSRRRKTETKPVQVKMICKEVVKLLKASLPSTIEIRPKLLSDSLIMADPIEIHQVLMNLSTNAAHAMEGKQDGLLEIQLREVELDSDFATAHGMSAGKFLKLLIADNGKGISPSTIDRIFEPFFSTKGDQGTGLGLSIVHGIIKSFNGAVTVYSEQGKCTTFNIYLPIIEVTEFKTFILEDDLPTGNESILCVDDEEIILYTLQKSLGSLGYNVIAARNGSEALELFHKNPQQFDLVITDQTMPKMTGNILAHKLMQCRSDIPIILCTGNVTFDLKEYEGYDAIKKVIMKPHLLREVAVVIREILDG